MINLEGHAVMFKLWQDECQMDSIKKTIRINYLALFRGINPELIVVMLRNILEYILNLI